MDYRKPNFRWVYGVVVLAILIGVFIYFQQKENTNFSLLQGRAALDLFTDTEDTEFDFEIQPFFGYRSSPQYYNANLDAIEVRTLITNPSNDQKTEQIELKVFQFTELWDTKVHQIPFSQRSEYIDGQPQDPANAFSEEELGNILHSQSRCGEEINEPSYEEPCYHYTNPDDENHPYGGYSIVDKPLRVIISDPITLDQNERYTFITSWTPSNCGYFRIIAQPFGYTGEWDSSIGKEAYVRVQGCDRGTLLENGEVEGSSVNNGGTSTIYDTTELPGTANGLMAFIIPILGVMAGGAMMQVGLRNVKWKL